MRHLPADGRRRVSRDHDLWPLRQVVALRRSLRGPVATHVRRASQTCQPAPPTNTRTRWIRRNGCQTVHYPCRQPRRGSAGRHRHLVATRGAVLAQCVDWAGVQPWSNGKVGLNGISYYAENQWQAARCDLSTSPPFALGRVRPISTATWRHHGGDLLPPFCRTGRGRSSIPCRTAAARAVSRAA